MHKPPRCAGASPQRRCASRSARRRYSAATLVAVSAGRAVGGGPSRYRQRLSLARAADAISRHRPRCRDRPCDRRIAAPEANQNDLGRFSRPHPPRPRNSRSAEYNRTNPDRRSADRRPGGSDRTQSLDAACCSGADPARRQSPRSLALRTPPVSAHTSLSTRIVVLCGLGRHHRFGRASRPPVEPGRIGARASCDTRSRLLGVDYDRDTAGDREKAECP